MNALGNISIQNILPGMDRSDTTQDMYAGYIMYNVTGDLLGTPSSGSTVSDMLIGQDTTLKRFSVKYQSIHGYVSIVVCSFGIILNIMNIVVLTQKSMISSTNYILTALAIADMLTMVSYLPYAVYFYCITIPDQNYKHPKGWIIYLVFNTNFIITCHTIAMWLTVALAVFRYIVVCHHTLGPKLCNLHRAKITIGAVFVSTVLFCTPNYVLYKTKALDGGGWWFEMNDFISPFLKVFTFWLFGVVLKIAPCILLTVLSSLLIYAMSQAAKKRRRLKSQGKRAESERASEHNRTTAMLVAVVLCFVIAELPQGILAFLSGVDTNIFMNVYVPLGDVWDIIVLFNSSVNFILYFMSRQFRKTFREVFFPRCPSVLTKTPNGVHYSSINQTQSTKL